MLDFRSLSPQAYSKLVDYLVQFRNFVSALWEQSKPRLQHAATTINALIAATNTFKSAVQITPIVLSVLTVLATAPLIGYLLPTFFLIKYALLVLLLGISAFTGYSKFCELERRSELDLLTLKQQAEIKALKKENQELNQRISSLEQRFVGDLKSKPQRELFLRSCSAPTLDFNEERKTFSSPLPRKVR